MTASARQRIVRLVDAARRLALPGQRHQALVRQLAASTGLTPAGVRLAFQLSLETHCTEEELTQLIRRSPPAGRTWVLLSSNVFSAPLRAIAMALAASDDVVVRSSRREPVFVDALHQEAPDLFSVASQLSPQPGDQVHAYGSDGTLERIRAELPEGVRLRSFGSGFGAAWLAHPGELGWAAALARDVAVFDQRGCLSPRLVFVEPSVNLAQVMELARAELDAVEARVPCGRLPESEQSASIWFKQTLQACSPRILAAGQGWIAEQPWGAELVIAPSGRNLVFHQCSRPLELLRAMAGQLTTLGVWGLPVDFLRARVALPNLRVVALGEMQSPPLDGPVDLRVTAD